MIIANAGKILQTPRVFRERAHHLANGVAAFMHRRPAWIRVGTECPPYGHCR